MGKQGPPLNAMYIQSQDAAPTPNASELDDFIHRFGDVVAVYYENIETGYTYSYNGDEIYSSASTIKAPYCLYIYYLAEQGLADLDSLHTYYEENFQEGTGIIQDMEFGSEFTEHQLLRYAIRNSDNVAIRMLSDKYGTYGFREFVAENGGERDLLSRVSNNVHSARITANACGMYLRMLYDYIEGEHAYSAQLKTDMLSTTYTMLASNYRMANKHGWSELSNAFHDMAIIYADSPYFLVILSNFHTGSRGDLAIFRAISTVVQDFNHKYFIEPIVLPEDGLDIEDNAFEHRETIPEPEPTIEPSPNPNHELGSMQAPPDDNPPPYESIIGDLPALVDIGDDAEHSPNTAVNNFIYIIITITIIFILLCAALFYIIVKSNFAAKLTSENTDR